jgi:hypothetical protein
MQAHSFYQDLHQSWYGNTLPRLRTYVPERYIIVKKIKVPMKRAFVLPTRPDSCTVCDPPHVIEDGLTPPLSEKTTGFGCSWP